MRKRKRKREIRKISNETIWSNSSDCIREPELVEPVVPCYLLENFYIATDEPVATLVDHLYVRMARVTRAKLPTRSLFFVVPIEFGVSDNSIVLA